MLPPIPNITIRDPLTPKTRADLPNSQSAPEIVGLKALTNAAQVLARPCTRPRFITDRGSFETDSVVITITDVNVSTSATPIRIMHNTIAKPENTVNSVTPKNLNVGNSICAGIKRIIPVYIINK